jgi:hypothetical protein
LPVYGEKNSRLREMETNYQNNAEEKKNHLETLIPSVHKNEFDLKDKENILKDFYNNIQLFNRLFYEAKKETFKK